MPHRTIQLRFKLLIDPDSRFFILQLWFCLIRGSLEMPDELGRARKWRDSSAESILDSAEKPCFSKVMIGRTR
jgi:hypothetical protein